MPIGAFDSAFFAPFNDDNWQGFPAQREALLSGLEASGATGVIFVSGDFHFACFGRVARKGPGSTLFEALVGPGAQGPNPLPAYPSGDPWEFSSAVNNYTTFQLDPFTRTGPRPLPRRRRAHSLRTNRRRLTHFFFDLRSDNSTILRKSSQSTSTSTPITTMPRFSFVASKANCELFSAAAASDMGAV